MGQNRTGQDRLKLDERNRSRNIWEQSEGKETTIGRRDGRE
jgi:hypothetical protein